MLDALTQDERDFIDELLFADLLMWAFQFVRTRTSYRFNESLDAVYQRETALGIDFNAHALARVDALASLNRLQDTVQEKVCFIEGSWDGDSLGWFIRLSAITERPSASHSHYTKHDLCVVRGIKDQVEYATALGEELARLAGTTFYLTSVEINDEKRWWDTHVGEP